MNNVLGPSTELGGPHRVLYSWDKQEPGLSSSTSCGVCLQQTGSFCFSQQQHRDCFIAFWRSQRLAQKRCAAHDKCVMASVWVFLSLQFMLQCDQYRWLVFPVLFCRLLCYFLFILPLCCLLAPGPRQPSLPSVSVYQMFPVYIL